MKSTTQMIANTPFRQGIQRAREHFHPRLIRPDRLMHQNQLQQSLAWKFRGATKAAMYRIEIADGSVDDFIDRIRIKSDNV